MKVVSLGKLTSWTPDEWKHPIGMPAGGSEENTMSVIACLREADLFEPCATLKSIW